VTRLRSGDWPAKVDHALAGDRRVRGFTFAQALVPVGIALFIGVAIAAQRTMIVKEFEPGDVIFAEATPAGRSTW
jgi:hypothetical protein